MSVLPDQQGSLRWLIYCAMLTAGLIVAAVLVADRLSFSAMIFSAVMFLGMAAVSLFFRRSPDAFIVGLLASLNIAAYNPVKAALNAIPFSFDPVFADLDKLLFLGVDPYRLLLWLNVDWLGPVYSWGWSLAISASLVATAVRQRFDLAFLYFLSWSVLGPLLHVLMPAAGPIFYARLGYGDRFLPVEQASVAAGYADYLWANYQRGEFGLGGGISAMPSLHIMLAVWVVIVWQDTKLAWLAWAFAILMFAMSISTGWHYAVDGIVAGAAMWLAYGGVTRKAPFQRSTNALDDPSKAG